MQVAEKEKERKQAFHWCFTYYPLQRASYVIESTEETQKDSDDETKEAAVPAVTSGDPSQPTASSLTDSGGGRDGNGGSRAPASGGERSHFV